jgi:hypothetical protein
VSKFGSVADYEPNVINQDFMGLYWVSALSYAKRIGFFDAMCALSPKVDAVLNWIVAKFRQSVCGRLNHTTSPAMFGADYLTGIWAQAKIAASGGDMTATGGLPQSWAELSSAYPEASSWDVWNFYPDNNFSFGPAETGLTRNSDSMDFLFAAPGMLKYMLGLSGADLDAAEATALGRRNAKKAAEEARGDAAGTQWFTYSKASFQPVRPDGWPD